MLKISNVHKTFNPNTINEKKALNGVDLVLNEGDFVTVIGGNGAGKSTMLNMIAGVYPVDCGTITVDGIDVTKLPEHKRAKYIGRVFQDPMNGTAADMQILENLALAKRRGQHRGLKFGVTRKEKEEYIDVLKSLDLGLETRLTSKVGLLSGGQRQAVTLLMATLKKPKILLLDMKDAINIGNRLIMMNEGKIIYDVSGEEKKNLTTADLLAKFKITSGGEEFDNDRVLLSTEADE